MHDEDREPAARERGAAFTPGWLPPYEQLISKGGWHMFESHRSHGAILIAAALALAASTPAWSQASGAGDAKEINSYRLTDAGLAKYTQAGRNLAPLASKAAAACENDDSDDSDESNNGTTIDQAVAKLNSTAGAAAAIKSAGMTTREYVVFSMAVFQSGMAAWALSQPGGKLPPGVSMDNVNFYRKHQAALETLGQNTKSADCDDE